jgi:hypothetical protein
MFNEHAEITGNTTYKRSQHDIQEEFEDTKGVIIIRKSKRNKTTQLPKGRGQTNKQRSTN